jgi:hypothetical protein
MNSIVLYVNVYCTMYSSGTCLTVQYGSSTTVLQYRRCGTPDCAMYSMNSTVCTSVLCTVQCTVAVPAWLCSMAPPLQYNSTGGVALLTVLCTQWTLLYVQVYCVLYNVQQRYLPDCAVWLLHYSTTVQAVWHSWLFYVLNELYCMYKCTVYCTMYSSGTCLTVQYGSSTTVLQYRRCGTPDCAMYSMNSTVCTSVLCTVQCTAAVPAWRCSKAPQLQCRRGGTPDCAMYSMNSTVCTSVLCTVQCTAAVPAWRCSMAPQLQCRRGGTPDYIHILYINVIENVSHAYVIKPIHTFYLCMPHNNGLFFKKWLYQSTNQEHKG